MESVPLPTIALRKLPGMNMTNSANDLAETVRVEAKKTDENPTGYIVIAASDFDAKAHKKYEGPDYVPVTEAGETA